MSACHFCMMAALVGLLMLDIAACNKSKESRAPEADTRPAAAESAAGSQVPTTAAGESSMPKPDGDGTITKSFPRSDSPAATAAKHPGLSASTAIRKMTPLIAETVSSGPMLVVWLFDRTATASNMVSEAQSELVAFYQDMAQRDEAANNLFTSIVSFGESVEFPVDEPTNSTVDVVKKLGALERDTSGKESTFAAVQAALKRYRDFRVERRYEVMFVVVTDEAGDDRPLLEDIIDSPEYSPRRLGTPIYVIGVPAPFGRTVGLRGSPEGAQVRQGPESRETERLSLAFWGDWYGVDLLDSGFGPFDLEWLCRDSGGMYLALRPAVDEQPRFQSRFDLEWPSANSERFDPAIMRRYAPEYVSRELYQAGIAGNKAKHALVEAAKLEGTGAVMFPTVEFIIRDEARLQRDLNEAQKVSARLEPEIERYYSLLSAAEADREKISEPRWQAGFDLAMGRVTAAKARIEGYNHMLAALKRGPQFKNPESDRWVLESDELTVDAGSGIEKLGAKARMYLDRVVREHPGTPWAVIAARELTSDVGWKWVEKGPNS